MAHEQHLYVAGFFMVICCLACAVCIEEQLQNLSSEKEKVEKMLRDYQSEVIEKLAIAGDNFDYKK